MKRTRSAAVITAAMGLTLSLVTGCSALAESSEPTQESGDSTQDSGDPSQDSGETEGLSKGSKSGGEPRDDGQEDATPAEFTVNLAKLPSGEEPGVAWFEDGVIHGPDGDVSVGDVELEFFTHLREGNYIGVGAIGGADTEHSLVGIDQDGTEYLADGTVAGEVAIPTGAESIAFAEYEKNDQGRVDYSSGRVVERHPSVDAAREQTSFDSRTFVVGYAGEAVVLKQSDPDGAKVWRPGTGIETIEGSLGASATHRASGLVSVVTGREEPDSGPIVPCSTVVKLGDGGTEGDELWSSCEVEPVSFSPDGQYVWAAETGHDTLPGAMYLLDARTGEKLMHVEIDGVTQRAAWESDGSVVFDVQDDDANTSALVRCHVEDGCELATEPAHYEGTMLEAPLPYLLAEGS